MVDYDRCSSTLWMMPLYNASFSFYGSYIGSRLLLQCCGALDWMELSSARRLHTYKYTCMSYVLLE